MRVFVIVVGFVWAGPAALHAQCADGTPPPCGVSVRAVVATATPPPEQRGRSFLVLPFRNITRAPESEWLIDGSPVLLADALGQWEEISVVSPERLYPALRRHGLEPGAVMDEDRVRRVAQETGGWTAVTGDVLATGNRIRVSVRAYDVATREVVVRASEEVGADEDIREAYERLAARLLSAAGFDGTELDLPAATTQSLEAYKAYVEGVALYHGGKIGASRERFEVAVGLDSMFAQAYAKLAEASMINIEALLDPQSPGYRYAERAAALASRLPERERRRLEATVAMFRGQLGHARELLDELLAADSNDVEALEDLAELHLLDPVLVTIDSVATRRGSFNSAARLAKRALGLAADRQENYGILVAVYARAAGQIEGRVAGLRNEPVSIPQLIASIGRPDQVFVPILRDTFELIPAESLSTLEPGFLRASRRRALEAAVAWVERWLVAAPNNAQAHQTAVDVYALGERYDDALRELAIADSIGVERQFGRIAAKRMEVLARAGRFAEAGRLVDSLIAAGDYGRQRLMTDALVANELAWLFNIQLAQGRLADADSMLRRLLDLVQSLRPDADSSTVIHNYLFLFTRRTDAAGPQRAVLIPVAVRRRAVDGVISHLSDLDDSAVVALHLLDVVNLSTRGAPDSVRTRYAAALHEAATRLVSAGRHRLALQAAVQAVITDTSRASLDAQLRTIEAILEVDPDNLDALYQRGRYAARSGQRLEDGALSLQRYLDEAAPGAWDPDFAAAHWRLGMIAEHRDDPDGARAHYEAALDENPEYANAKRALERLNLPEQHPR